MRSKGFLGGSYSDDSLSLNCARAINIFPRADPSGNGKSAGRFLPTPGLKQFCQLKAGEIRALRVFDGVLWAVANDTLYKVTSGGVATVVGTFDTIHGAIGITDNGRELAFADGLDYRVWDRSTFARVTGDGVPVGSQSLAFLDGYIISPIPGGQTFGISGLYAAKNWDILDRATAEGDPDPAVAVLVDHREVWIFGTKTAEVWYNAGAADFPLARFPGGFVEQGCAAPNSPSKTDNSIFWLGSNDHGQGIVWRANGYQPVRVSTHPVEDAIARYSKISDAIGWSYVDRGHSFYVLTFPTGQATWAYDAATNEWAERAYMAETGLLERHRMNTYCFAFGKHLVGDYANGKIYQLDPATFTDDGRPIARVRRWNGARTPRPVRYSRLELMLEAGLGNLTGDGTTPQVELRYSDDGAKSWSASLVEPAGETGQYGRRAVWDRLGASTDRSWEIRFSDACGMSWLDCDVEGR